jgi:hypothetical protein
MMCFTYAAIIGSDNRPIFNPFTRFNLSEAEQYGLLRVKFRLLIAFKAVES